MWPFTRERPDPNALLDEALYDRVLEIVREELGDLIDADRVVVRDSGWRDEHEWPSGYIQLVPARPEAAPIWMDILDDTVSFTAGKAGACFEIWTRYDTEWASFLIELIHSVRDGGYTEWVSRGWVFDHKVDMKFDLGGGKTHTSGYASLPDPYEDGEEERPAEGHHSYAPW